MPAVVMNPLDFIGFKPIPDGIVNLYSFPSRRIVLDFIHDQIVFENLDQESRDSIKLSRFLNSPIKISGNSLRMAFSRVKGSEEFNQIKGAEIQSFGEAKGSDIIGWYRRMDKDALSHLLEWRRKRENGIELKAIFQGQPGTVKLYKSDQTGSN